MEKQCLHKPEETLQETRLRATLQQYAPSTIDLEQGWAKIAPALGTPRKQVSFPQTSLSFLANALWQQQGEKRSLRYARVLVAAIILALVLVGVGAVAPISNRLDGNQVAHAYTRVNQSRLDQGVKVTVLEAYASDGGTGLVTTIQVGNLRGYLVIPGRDITLKYQQENLEIRQGGVFTNHVDNVNLSCQEYEFSAAHPPADAQTITLIWHEDEIRLSRLTSLNPPRWTDQTIHGDWTFQFTIPFYHNNSNPILGADSPLC